MTIGNDIHLAYIAGFFDGEGSITIHQNGKPSPRGISPNHTLSVSIGNTDPRVVSWLRDNFGGSLTHRKVAKENHRDVFQWGVRSSGAADFLKLILPFLRMKQQQALIAIEFQTEKSKYKKGMISAETLEAREAQRAEIRRLNGRGGTTP